MWLWHFLLIYRLNMILAVTLQTSSNHSACTLPYPDRFHAAVNFIVNNTPGDAPLISGAFVFIVCK